MQNKNLKLFLTADLFSQFGAGMTIAALSWYAIDISGSNQVVAAITIVNIIGGILMSLFAGLIIDYFPKKNITLISHIIRCIFVLVPLLFLVFYGYHSFFLYLIALSNGLGWNLYYPASKGLLKEISSNEELMKSNSGAEITMQIGLFSSGALAGSLYNFLGFNVILFIALIIFFVSIFITSLIKVNISQGVNVEKIGIKEMYIEGIRYFQGNTTIFLMGIILYIPFIGANLINTILPGYSINVLHANSVVYGLIDMAYGIGACVVGFTIIGLSKKLSVNFLIILGFLLATFTGLVLYFNTSKAMTGIMFFICGLCGPGIRSLIFTLIMQRVPEGLLGRAMTMWNLLSLVIQVIATYLIGIIMDVINPAWGFLIYSLIIVCGLFLFLLVKNKFSKYEKDTDNQYSSEVTSGS